MKVTLLNLLFGSPYYNIYQNLEKIVLQTKFRLVDHQVITTFFGIAIVSSRNRVFFKTFLHFLSIHKVSVRHSKIIHIRGIKQRKILCFTIFSQSYNLQEIIGFSLKVQLYLNLYALIMTVQ